MRKKVLWAGDACCATGFARVTHNVLEHLRHVMDVEVLGVNYRGDPHEYPYRIWPAFTGGDTWGINRIASIVEQVRPDVIVANNDTWLTPLFPQALRKRGIEVPVVGYMPVDGLNVKGAPLNLLAHAIFYTAFGEHEARMGGYVGPSSVIPHGVDLTVYRPIPRAAARERLGLNAKRTARAKHPISDDAFIVLNVNRNQPRKRLDLTIHAFAEWRRQTGVQDAWLYLHCAPKGDEGWAVENLARYYGVDDRLILTVKDASNWTGVIEDMMPWIYSAADVQLTTTQGEGWGLTTQEGMACGVPQIIPVWSALAEWVTSGAWRVPCTVQIATPSDINMIGGLPDRQDLMAALDEAYRNKDLRQRLGRAARALTENPVYRWEAIAGMFADVLTQPLRVPEPPDAARRP